MAIQPVGEAMAQQLANDLPWSDALGCRLLSTLPDQALSDYWGQQSEDAKGDAVPSLVDLRVELLQWAKKDHEVALWITRAWRLAHPEVVAAADHAVTEGLSPNSVRLLEEFEVESVLLAFLTDEFDDGRQLVLLPNRSRGPSLQRQNPRASRGPRPAIPRTMPLLGDSQPLAFPDGTMIAASATDIGCTFG
jgi:hypothetical protein